MSRRGATVVLVAVCLIAIVGVVALAIDGGVLFDKRRSVQAAADAAALAAADDLFKNYNTNQGVDKNGTAKASALSTAKANGFDNGGTTNTVTVNIPPASGFAAGQTCYAEVIIQFNQQRSFSAIFGAGTVPVQARAVAYGHPSPNGMYILDTKDPDSLDVTGIVTVQNNSGIQVNSSATGAAQIHNTGNLTCGGLNVVGTLQIQSPGSVSYTGGGSLNQGAGVIADPLASVPEPTPSGTNYGSPTYNTSTTIYPGIYNGITIGPSATVTMSPGIYYIEGNGIKWQAPPPNQPGGTLQGSGVMIYNTSGDHINPQPAGIMNLSAPTSGTYQGIIWFEPRTSNAQLHIESTQSITLAGTLYSQAGFWDIRPDGASTVFNFGSCIAFKAEFCDGNDQKSKSNGQINFNPNSGAPSQRPALVE
ncbi:MAG TPA: pilus assembly protein TadG-related protein [Pirellulales bacterium]|nr:pilus assembly protein TadG-related protein [Pirellulales bacterium]